MFLQSLEALNVFHTDIPKLPMGKYAHIITLRETNSFALFQTDGELNISRVSLGRADATPSTRIVLFKRKQSTPERLTGREPHAARQGRHRHDVIALLLQRGEDARHRLDRVGHDVVHEDDAVALHQAEGLVADGVDVAQGPVEGRARPQDL